MVILSDETRKIVKQRKLLFFLLIMIQVVMIVLYSIFVEYKSNGNTRLSYNYTSDNQDNITHVYPSLGDVTVMVFIGFGFVMAYFRDYAWSAIIISFGVAAWSLQMAILTNGFWYAVFSGDWKHKISVNFYTVLDGENTAGAVLVALGAVLGKLNVAQYFIMATMVTITQTFINQLTFVRLLANDIGGGMYIFLYGTVFGLSVALSLGKQDQTNSQNYISTRNSNIFSMIGTLFLWVYWPSWNSAWATGNSRLRAILNTILSLSGSCVTSFLVSPLIFNGKLTMKHILFGSISGGVVMGSIADMLIHPWASFFIGCLSGTVTVLGLHYITPRMNKTRFQDSCGVLFLAGIPGLASGLISAIIAGVAKFADYGSTLYIIFPLQHNNIRDSGKQAGYQLATVIIIIIVGTVCGLATGLLLNNRCFISIDNLFDDREIFDHVDDKEDIRSEEVVRIEMHKIDNPRVNDSDRQGLNAKINLDITKEHIKSSRNKKDNKKKRDSDHDVVLHIEIKINALE